MFQSWHNSTISFMNRCHAPCASTPAKQAIAHALGVACWQPCLARNGVA